MSSPTVGWTRWVDGLVTDVVHNVAAAAFNVTSSGRIWCLSLVGDELTSSIVEVKETQRLSHSAGVASRVLCTSTGSEYDLRQQSSASAERSVEDMRCEVECLRAAGKHPNIATLHAERFSHEARGLHCRLLLCDACSGDLATQLARRRQDALEVTAVAELACQLSIGLAHLHANGILCGRHGLTPEGVLLGLDGYWKIGNFSDALQLSHVVTMREDAWRLHWRGFHIEEVPPECRKQSQPTSGLDLWLLGRLLAISWLGRIKAKTSLIQQRDSCGGTLVHVEPGLLLDSTAAHLWMLLHTLLAAEPSHRLSASEVARLCGNLSEVTADELLVQMPVGSRFHCSGFAATCARSVALKAVTALLVDDADRKTALSTLLGLSLPRLREKLPEFGVAAEDLERICDNCGIDIQCGDALAVSVGLASKAPLQSETCTDNIPVLIDADQPPLLMPVPPRKLSAEDGSISTEDGSGTSASEADDDFFEELVNISPETNSGSKKDK